MWFYEIAPLILNCPQCVTVVGVYPMMDWQCVPSLTSSTSERDSSLTIILYWISGSGKLQGPSKAGLLSVKH